jgi:4-methylaminobutanoate oxidase (formaldehyde-forming)
MLFSGQTDHTKERIPMAESLPTRAQVVIIGGGIMGTSTAYHLTKLGITDIVLLEQGQLSSGTTWHAAGLVGQLRATESGTRLVQYSASLYENLEAETGLATGFKRVGGVTVARTPERVVQLQRTAAAAEAYDLDCEWLTPAQARERYPILETSDLLGALWLPGDGTVNPVDITASLARGARQGGVRIFEKVRVTDVSTTNGAVSGVTTDLGHIEAEIVVNCAGQWAKAVGLLAGVHVPLHSAEHFYVVTEQIDGVHRMLPILRDPDGYTYFKEEVGGLVVGGFEPVAKPWVSPDQLPYPFEFQLLDEDWDHFAILMDSALHRIPALHDTGIRKFYNGPESFTPDNQFILGEAPDLKNFFVGAGFNSVGIASGGGAGRALAEWIVEGEPTSDLVAVDIRRFGSFNANNRWLRDRVGEVLGLHYAVPWPNRELETARPFRRSPLYEVTEANGALFGSKMGWERPNVFAPRGTPAVLEYSWAKPNWLAWSEAEQRATREAVAVYDQTSFGKLLISGPGSLELLQRCCCAQMDVPVGRAVYTGMLNRHGGYEADVTITRLSFDSWLLVTSAASPVRDRVWLERHRLEGEQVEVIDITGSLAVLGVMGPNSRQLLSRLTDADLSDEGHPFSTSQEIALGQATVRATRITYVGELGWELYIPTEFALDAYRDLKAAGSDLGLIDAGYYTINTLRLDKGYRAFGAELTPDFGPVESGLTFTAKLDTDSSFLGRDQVLAAKEAGPRRRLGSFLLDDPTEMLWGGELVLGPEGACGQVTSAAWSATLGASVGLAWLWHRDGSAMTLADVNQGVYRIRVGGKEIPARFSSKPLYDPMNQRIRP